MCLKTLTNLGGVGEVQIDVFSSTAIGQFTALRQIYVCRHD